MDLLRRAVGDKKLTYLGFSYGSYLGEVYANLYPDRVRALAIDGVLDPVAWAGTKKTAEHPDRGLDSVRPRARARPCGRPWCVATRPAPTKCAFSAGNPVANYEKIAQRLRKGTPVRDRSRDRRPLSGRHLRRLRRHHAVACCTTATTVPDYVTDYASYLYELIDPTSSAGERGAAQGDGARR